MYIYRIGSVVALATALLFTGCIDEETRESFSQLAQSAQQMQEGAQEMSRSMQEMQDEDREPVEPVNFRELRDLLPSQVAGLEEVDRGGESRQMGGFTLVNAKVEFQGDNRERIEVAITDIGGAPGLSAVGIGMMMMEVDSESSSGFERTGSYNGHRMHEKFDTNNGRGEKTVLIDQRFIVKVSGRNTSFERIESALQSVNFNSLERLGG